MLLLWRLEQRSAGQCPPQTLASGTHQEGAALQANHDVRELQGNGAGPRLTLTCLSSCNYRNARALWRDGPLGLWRPQAKGSPSRPSHT